MANSTGGAGSRGRAWTVLALATAILTAAAALAWREQARAETSEARDLKTACLATACDTEQRDHLDQLKALDTSESRKALEEVAAGKDRTAAALALLTMGRADYDGARAKLKTAFEDESRPHAVRAAAFQAWARAEAAGGTSWATIESYAQAKTQEGTPLRDSALAVKAVLFPERAK